MRRAVPGLLCALAFAGSSPGQHLTLDAETEGWHGTTVVKDGAVGAAAHFDGDRARIDAGPLPVSSRRPFTLRCHLRTTRGSFCTPLMARDGERVGVSLVMGREDGRISFEAWSWQRVRLVSRTRIDDGRWHRIEVCYDPGTTTAILFVDGRAEAVGELGPGESESAQLRLGDNIGAHQPFLGDLDEVEFLPETGMRAFAPVLDRSERANALQRIRTAALPPRTPALAADRLADFGERRQVVRAHVRDCLGLDPLPEQTPLDVVVHGGLERSAVVVERISFVGFAGRRATGWLWRPKDPPRGRAPAVLCPHGHWGNGAREPVVQARCASFARFGWTALAIDSSHATAIAAGSSPIGVMTWHNLRGLRLLQQRTDVDPERIAVTGCSGGGQQTYYLMAAADDGAFAAAAPICMACYYDAILADDSAHCACNFLPRLGTATDVPEMCAVFAPQPAFFGSVTGDWTRRFPERALPELRGLWEFLGVGEDLRSLHRNEGHDYSKPMREAVYGFLHDALLGRADGMVRDAVAEPEFTPWSPQELADLGGPPPDQLPDPAFLQQELLGRRPPLTDPRELAPALPWRVERQPVEWRRDRDAGGWRAGIVRAPDGAPIPLQLRNDLQLRSDDQPWRVVLHPGGQVGAMLDGTATDRTVLTDPRFLGEWQPFASAWRRNGLLLGRGELYEAAHDLALVCRSLPGEGPVHVDAVGDTGPIAVVAAFLCPRVARVSAPEGVPYDRDPNRTPHAPELLRLRSTGPEGRSGLDWFAARIADRCELTWTR